LKIGIDCTSLCRKITGIEYYTLNLVKNILTVDKKNEYTIFFRKEVHSELKRFEKKAKFLIFPINNQIFCEQIWLPYIVRREKVELMHFPAFPPGVLIPKNYIITIFDATVWKYPKTLSWKGKFYMKPLITLATKRASKILTISENSKKDIIKFSKVPTNKVENTGIAISKIFKPLGNKLLLEKIKKKYNLPTKFILTVCSIEPRKNLLNLLEAYKLLLDINPKIQHKLVLVGRKAWGKNLISNKIIDLKLKNNIIMTGYVPEHDLVGIYSLAEIFVFPSIYEGFGLPPLEAMACGTPVVSSNTSSLPEVVGNAALMINPYNVNKIMDAIATLIYNPEMRRTLIERGKERITKFSWEDVARKTINIYKS